jgi:hypothetical protein
LMFPSLERQWVWRGMQLCFGALRSISGSGERFVGAT